MAVAAAGPTPASSLASLTPGLTPGITPPLAAVLPLPDDAPASRRVGILGANRLVASVLTTLLRDSGWEPDVIGPEILSAPRRPGTPPLALPPMLVVDTAPNRVPWDITQGRRVVALVGLGSPDVLDILRHGVRGVVTDEAAEEDLGMAVECAHRDVFTMSTPVLDSLLHLLDRRTQDQETARARIAHLSPRDVELLGFIGQGLGNAEIATRRCLSPSTVKAQVRDLLRRLGGCSRFEAALLAAECDLP